MIASVLGDSARPLVSEIERATTEHARIFWLSIAVIVLAGLATAFVSYLVWKSGNRVQDAVRADADTRIAAAQAAAAGATRDAAKANEGTAVALKDAAAANERTGKLELEVAQQQRAAAEQRERAAKAEHDLLELRQRMALRRLSTDQRTAIVSALRRAPPEVIEVIRLGDAEARDFANDLIAALEAGGWTVRLMSVGIMPPTYGLVYSVGPVSAMNASRKALLDGLKTAGIPVATESGGSHTLLVGLKPVAP